MRRNPGEARLLGLWTAGCLAVLLVAGILWVGDLALQWPVLAVPLVWALIAARPRGSAVVRDRYHPRPAVVRDRYDDRYDDRYGDRYDGGDRGGDRYGDRYGYDDPYPATREAPTLPLPPQDRRPRDR